MIVPALVRERNMGGAPLPPEGSGGIADFPEEHQCKASGRNQLVKGNTY